MRALIKSQTIAIGLAMFSMFFGAGNVIFPIALGQAAGDQNIFAIAGLLLTAVAIPFIGVLAMILFKGDYRSFFGKLGKIPGFLLSFFVILLLGPLGSTPRCIALSFSTLKSSFPSLSVWVFSAISCVIIFLCTFRKNSMMTLLGRILTPLLLVAILVLIIKGLFLPHEVNPSSLSHSMAFLKGLKEGYNTMDLLAAFFFSASVFSILKKRQESSPRSNQSPVKLALKASGIGAFLLSVVYIGFSFIASFHGSHLAGGKEELLSNLAHAIAGPFGGLLVCIIISLACLTTAIALTSVFADFLRKEVLKEKISYPQALMISLGGTFIVSIFQFQGISAFLTPILQVCYPGLILLTFFSLGHQLFRLKLVKASLNFFQNFKLEKK